MSEPELYVQWKGTEVCLDFQCECSAEEDAYEFHFDGFMFGHVKCPRCGTVWEIDAHPKVTRSSRTEAELLTRAEGAS